ncbi:MAG: hypothetical protein AAFR49_16330, partial [Pseudomonadota bacterium]
MVSAGLDSILARRRLSQWPIIAAIGAIAALGQEPLGLWPATICALGLIFALIRKAASGKQALGIGWIAGAGYFAVALSWIVEPFLVDLARHGWMAPFALLGVSVGFGLFWAFFDGNPAKSHSFLWDQISPFFGIYGKTVTLLTEK